MLLLLEVFDEFLSQFFQIFFIFSARRHHLSEMVFEALEAFPPREQRDEDTPDEEEISSFIARTTTKLTHDLSSIRFRALQSLHFLSLIHI